MNPGEPIPVSRNIHRCLDLLSRMQRLEFRLILDRIFHRHRCHPSGDIFVMDARHLRIRINRDNGAAEWKLARLLPVRAGARENQATTQ